MRRFRCAALAAVAVVSFASVASAADMPAKVPMYTKTPMAPPAYSWTGFYIGGDVGGAWTSNTGTWNMLPAIGLPVSANAISGSNGGSSFVGGLHAGYNWQFAPTWVAGIEGDWSWAKASGSFTQPWTFLGTSIINTGLFTNMSSTLDWVSSLRARLGYLVLPNLLAYGTGGVAWGKFDYVASAFNTGAGGYNASTAFSSTQVGYTVGGGLEWAMTNNWFLRGEYLFYRFNSAPSVVIPDIRTPLDNQSGFSWSSTNVSVARAGLSYKF
jgi:outer membrane immunogenic protein